MDGSSCDCVHIRKDIECFKKSEMCGCVTFGDGSTCMGWEGKMLSVSASMNKTKEQAMAWCEREPL
jgi:hypothetical protein